MIAGTPAVRAVATPVLARLAAGPSRGVVDAVTAGSVRIDAGGFVVVLAAPGVPLLPNAVALGAWPARSGPPPPGTVVRLRPGRIEASGWVLAWDPARPPAWDPTLATVRAGREGLRRRGGAILRACGVDVEPAPAALARAIAAGGAGVGSTAAGRDGVGLLAAALAARDPAAAGAAAHLLVGRGPGLTPEGDDLLAGVAATVAAAGAAAGMGDRERSVWLSGLAPPRLRALTTALSATLLELAVEGQVAAPVHVLLRGMASPDEVPREGMARLLAVGHSTGRAYALAVGAGAVLLAARSSQGAGSRPGERLFPWLH